MQHEFKIGVYYPWWTHTAELAETLSTFLTFLILSIRSITIAINQSLK